MVAPALPLALPPTARAAFAVVIGVVLAMSAFDACALARMEACHVADEHDIAALFDRWNDALKTGDPDQVVANYAPRSVLLATASDEPRVTPAEKRDYFRNFLAKKPVGRIDFRSIMIDCNTAVDVGLYTFTFGDGRKLPARYTFTYGWVGDRWLITSHHSSELPGAK